MRLHQVAFIVGIGIALVACGVDSTGPTYADVVGSYSMVGYNGASLPALIGSSDREIIEMLGGTEVLRADHSYEETWSLRVTDKPGWGCECVQISTDVVDAGTFGLAGNTITFHPDIGGEPYTGVLSKGALTYTFGPLSIKYQK